MGRIVIAGIKVDTEDIDLLLRHKPLDELDALVQADDEMLNAMPQDDPSRSYWEHRSESHRIARLMAEYCVLNDVPTVDLPLKTRDSTQGLYALEKCRVLEAEVEGLKKEIRSNGNRKRKTYKY